MERHEAKNAPLSTVEHLLEYIPKSIQREHLSLIKNASLMEYNRSP